jgi:diguanylate cyclase (GGDEF)-like protein
MKLPSFFDMLWQVANKGLKLDDSDDLKLKKTMLTFIALGIASMAIFWGLLYIYVGYTLAGIIPLSYAVISFGSIFFFCRSKRFLFFRFSQLLMILLLPFTLMWSLGGFANGSVVMIWAVFTPVAALFFSDIGEAIGWLVAFLALVVISAIIDPHVAAMVEPMKTSTNTLFFLLNMGASFLLLYMVLLYFVRDRQKVNQKVIDAYTQLTRTHLQLESNEKRIREMMHTDALTGIANRRHLEEKLDEELSRMHRYKNSLAVVMTDIDNFKRINDRYGHPAGDLVIQTYAQIIEEQIRSNDFVARVGGEEYLILLPNVDESGAMTQAERIREALANYRFEEFPRARVTASFGVICVEANEGASELLNRVDKALYQSKKSGKDRVSFLPYSSAA